MASTDTLKQELDDLRKKQRQVDSRLEELDKLRGGRRFQGHFAGRQQSGPKRGRDHDESSGFQQRAHENSELGNEGSTKRRLTSAIAAKPKLTSMIARAPPSASAATNEANDEKPTTPRATVAPTPEVQQRNKRLLSRTLIGTLNAFKKQSTERDEVLTKRVEIEEQVTQREQEERQKRIELSRKELEEQRIQRDKLRRQISRKARLLHAQLTLQRHEKRATLYTNYLTTKASPSLLYLPAKHNELTQKLLDERKAGLEATLAELREKHKIPEELLKEDVDEDDDDKEASDVDAEQEQEGPLMRKRAALDTSTTGAEHEDVDFAPNAETEAIDQIVQGDDRAQ